METFVVLVIFHSGSTITAEIQGVIDACVKLTGMPDLTLSFMVSFLQFFFGKFSRFFKFMHRLI